MTEPSARGAALAVLLRVETKGAYANLALEDCLARSLLSARDRAFCAELVYGTVRMRAHLDHLLGQLLAKPLAQLPALVRNTLRLSLYQLAFMPGLKAYAAINEAVGLIKRSGQAGFAGLANAVLRNYQRRRGELSLPAPEDGLAYLCLTLSHPSWLSERWLRRLGPAEAAALAQADNRPPLLCLRANTLRTERERLMADLAAAGYEARASALTPEGVLLPQGGAVERLPGFGGGAFAVQDDGAILVGHAVRPAPGEAILDLCAAPGGKTAHLAALAHNGAEITAVDLHEHKVALILENCRRLGAQNVNAVAADARLYEPGRAFHAVLLDAPCSGTGVLRRRADLRWRRKPSDLYDLAALQRTLLGRAAALVLPGGRLIYSTCSLEPEENEEQIRWFLAGHPGFAADELRPSLPASAAELCGNDPWLYLWPHKQETDGFFICRMRRRE